jgi:hypothetical protein
MDGNENQFASSTYEVEDRYEATSASEVVCWSRMQAESGQELSAILERKELERRAGGGVFFWGIGNPPPRAIAGLAKLRAPVGVIFSVMRSKPKSVDVSPEAVLLWTHYLDIGGMRRPLPPGAVVTSRSSTAKGDKRVHFALMCHSSYPLSMGDYGPFDHLAYRNLSEAGGTIGASQVTALVKKVTRYGSDARYRVNLEASLVGSYWVKLVDPVLLGSHHRDLIDHSSSLNVDDWLLLSSQLRQAQADLEDEDSQPLLI